MASSEVYKVVLSGGAPWGFRLQGGSEFRAPLRIAKITPGSKAQKANIYEGLYVHAINDCPSERLTHSEALNIVKKTGNHLELELCWKPETFSQPTSSGSYTTEDIQSTHVSKATFKPSSSQAPPYATLPRGGPGWRELDENFNETYASEDLPPPPEMPPKVFEKPQPIGRGGRRFVDSSNESYGHPPLTSSSIGSEEDFNMANGDTSSQDSGQQNINQRPAMNQFRKQKVNAEIEATKEPKPLPKKVPPPPPAKPERRYPNIMEEERYKGPSRPAIRRGTKWYKEMFKDMHATAGVTSSLSALLANDAIKAGDEHLGDGPAEDFVHPMQARPVEYEPELSEPQQRKISAPVQQARHPPPVHRPSLPQMSPTSHLPPGGAQQVPHDHVPTWYQDMVKGEKIPKDEPISYGVHHRKTSSDSDEGKRYTGLQSPVFANRPPLYVPPLSKSAADRNVVRPVPTTVTVQQEEKSKPPTATSLYEKRFRGGTAPANERNRSASEELGVKHQPPSDEELIRKREEEARLRREEEERRRREEEREFLRRQQEEQEQREREAEIRRRKQAAEAAAAAKKAAEHPQFFAMALYNFNAQSPKELSFKKGDYIVVKRQIDRNWIEGEINGKFGIFPTNHVELRPIDDEEETQETPPSPYVAVEGEAKVKYNFDAQSPRELSIGKNEIVTLTRRVDQNWYEAFYQGRKGIIPAAYLEVLREPGLAQKGSISPKATEQPKRQDFVQREEPIKQIQTQPVSHSPQQVTEIRKTTTTTTYDQRSEQPRSYGEPIRIPSQQSHSPPQPQVQYIYSKEPEPAVLPAQFVEDNEVFPMEGERYKAAYSYVPQNDDELPLEEGEEVIVLEKCDDGWFVGHSIRTGLFGTFPGNYVVALSL